MIFDHRVNYKALVWNEQYTWIESLCWTFRQHVIFDYINHFEHLLRSDQYIVNWTLQLYILHDILSHFTRFKPFLPTEQCNWTRSLFGCFINSVIFNHGSKSKSSVLNVQYTRTKLFWERLINHVILDYVITCQHLHRSEQYTWAESF